MEAFYKREQGHNYIMFQVEPRLAGTAEISPGGGKQEHWDSQIEMVRRNRIPGLAQLSIQWEDNKMYYGYDITGMQPVSRVMEIRDMSGDEIKEFLQQLADVILRLEQFLLDRDDLVLEPEYIYVQLEGPRYFFFICPGQEGGYREHMKRLSQYLLEKADGEDTESAGLVFRLYRLCASGEAEPETLTACLNEDSLKPQAENTSGRERYGCREDTERKEEAEWQEQIDDMRLGEKEDKKRYRTGIRGILHRIFRRTPDGLESMWDELEPDNRRLSNRTGGEKTQSFTEERPTEVLYVEEDSMLSPTLCCQESQEVIPLTHFPFLVGTQENWAHYNPGFHGVSRLHLKLEKKNGMYWIMDLNSTNGTKLNGSPLLPNEEKQIRNGDHIWIAGLMYEFMEFDRKEKSC